MIAQDKVITLFYLVDELLDAIRHKEYPNTQSKMSDAEVITTAIIACLDYGGHMGKACHYMQAAGYVPLMLSKSRFNRRLHRLSNIVTDIFNCFGNQLKLILGAHDFILDSFPIKICHNTRIERCRLIKEKAFRGRNASKREYFYGVKVQVLSTQDRVPVEFAFVPGSENDVNTLRKLPMAVPEGSCIYADSAYTDYTVEDDMADGDGVFLKAARRKNSKRPDTPSGAFLKQQLRKPIESAFSGITQDFLRTIHATTFKGFLLKLSLFILAFALDSIA